MRRYALSAGLLAMAMFAVTGCKRPGSGGGDQALAKNTAKVKVKCHEKNGFDFSMNNFTIEVDSNGTASWTGDNSDVAMQIEVKPGHAWPFDSAPPLIPRQGTVGSGRVKSGLKADTVKYNIQFVCGSGAAADTIVIDPDIILVGGGGFRDESDPQM